MPHDPQSAFELTRMALLKMCGATAPAGLPNLPPLPGLPADILQQAQQQQDKALNLHLQRQKAMDEASKELKEDIMRSKEDRLRSEDTEDETVEDEEAKKSSDDSTMHNENSLSPPHGGQDPNGPTLSTPGAHPKKRHRSNDSEEVEEVSSPKKQLQNPLGIPGANFKIANRGV